MPTVRQCGRAHGTSAQGRYIYAGSGGAGTFGGTPVRPFDIALDGRRFLMIKQGGGDDAPAPRNLVVVQHWFEELRRLVPAL